MRRLRAAISPISVAVAVILASGLAVRLASNDYGLPYVYSADEGSHFTNRAVAMFGGDPNPGYFQNPSGFTYLVYGALRVRDAGLWPLGPRAAPEQFSVDPASIWITGRTVAALLCMLGVLAAFAAGRRLFGPREGLAAAAVLGFAFLPVAYSRVAVTDVGTFAGVALSLMWAIRASEIGGRREFLLAGAAAGLAVGFKYTAGLVLVPLVLAAALRVRREPAVLGHLALGLAAATGAFLLTTPYIVLDFETARRQIQAQAQTAGQFAKVGQAGDSGALYYLESLGWGLGLLPSAFAALGAVLLARRRPAGALLLAALPVALFAYLSLQSRYFGRWLLPAYPALALLAGYGISRTAQALGGLRGVSRASTGIVTAALLAAVLLQPLAADLRSGAVLGRTDTRGIARTYLAERLRPSARVVIEPAVPSRYYRLVRRESRSVARSRKQFVRGYIKQNRESRIDYAATLAPKTIDLYRRTGYCHVMTLSLLRGRAERDRAPAALAYYRRLERESSLLLALSPLWPGSDPVPFSFDLSYNYYPRAFMRPGPAVRIYRLSRCRQGFGPLPPGAAATAAEA